MSDADHSQRILARRQHRILGLYLAVRAWANNLDAIHVDREDFCRFLGIKVVKKARLDQFEEDVKEWFPELSIFYFSGQVFSGIYLSRVPLEGILSTRRMMTPERIKLARKEGLAIEDLSNIVKDVKKLKEADLVSYVSLLSSGLEVPSRKNLSVKKDPSA